MNYRRIFLMIGMGLLAVPTAPFPSIIIPPAVVGLGENVLCLCWETACEKRKRKR